MSLSEVQGLRVRQSVSRLEVHVMSTDSIEANGIGSFIENLVN